MRVNWFSADEITAELSVVRALRHHNSYHSLDTSPFPAEPYHFLCLAESEHLHSHVSAPLQQYHDGIFLMPLLGLGAVQAATLFLG